MKKIIEDLDTTVKELGLKEIDLRVLSENIEPRIKVRFITKDNRVFEKNIDTRLMVKIHESYQNQVWGWITEEAKVNLEKE